MNRSKHILPIIVISQFCCTALWFAGNAVMSDLVINFNLNENALGHLTSVVQFGFIMGTLIFAILSIADRFSPSKVFLISAIFGALFNAITILDGNTFSSLLLLRFCVGFCLAGIYPVGMKIAADYFAKGLGKSLGLLVGALVIGTAFPHLLKGATTTLPWKSVLLIVSAFAISGGLAVYLFVPDGPFRKAGSKVNLKAFFKVFKNQKFRSAAFGYFGHMWELYAFWAFVPIILKTYSEASPQTSFNIPILSFIIIGIGGLACIIAGYISQTNGVKRTAFIALFISCLCCLLSPFILSIEFPNILILFLLIWGFAVVADSPLFSTLVAQNADPQIKGTALTIVNCIGFAISIFSIQLINILIVSTNPNIVFVILAIGPILGLLALIEKVKIRN